MLRPSSTRHVYFLPGILLLVGLPLHGQNKVTTKDCSLAAEDYAVYSAVFRSREHSVDPPLELVIVDETVTTEEVPGSDAWNFQSKSKPAPSNETIADFKSHGLKRRSLKPSLDSKITYTLAPRAEIEGYFDRKVGGDGWERFAEQHPKAPGFVDVSAVGYNRARNHALVYLGHHCGWLCGTGNLCFLAKENGRWVIKNEYMQWIS
jgi:hypothetical protein